MTEHLSSSSHVLRSPYTSQDVEAVAAAVTAYQKGKFRWIVTRQARFHRLLWNRLICKIYIYISLFCQWPQFFERYFHVCVCLTHFENTQFSKHLAFIHRGATSWAGESNGLFTYLLGVSKSVCLFIWTLLVKRFCCPSCNI